MPPGRGGICWYLHEVHEAGVQDTCEEFAETVCDGNRAVVCRVMFRAFFVEGCNIGFLPCSWELGCLVYVVKELD